MIDPKTIQELPFLLVFHSDPTDLSESIVALFIVAVASSMKAAMELSEGGVEELKQPLLIHLSIEVGGRKVCGHIEPAQPGGPRVAYQPGAHTVN